MSKYLEFKVRVPAHGTDGAKLPVAAVRSYIKDAVESWSGQFNPDEDNMFYWCGDDKTTVTQVRQKKGEKSLYTVVLIRPDYMKVDGVEWPLDIYVAIGVEASEAMLAVRPAKEEVYKADLKDDLHPASVDDYQVLAVFEGAHSPKLFGWQAGGQG